MIDKNSPTRQLIIKPTSACNFSCEFCSAAHLNIPIHTKVPAALKEYLIKNKPNDLIITGGEPLINPKSYFEDLFDIMDSLNIEYEIGLTSNLVLWYNNPEEWDWMFNKPNVGIDTSFQYGNDRKDEKIYTEERFIELYKAFEKRYHKPLLFIYVVNSENEKYVRDACLLAKRLGTDVKFNSQIPVGRATEYYPRYKLLALFLDLLKEGLLTTDSVTIESIKHYQCPYASCYKYCAANRAVYVNEKEELVEGNCEDQLSSEGRLKIKRENPLFNRCLFCPMFSLCNGCSINKDSTEPIKDEHCKWMKDHCDELKKYGLI